MKNTRQNLTSAIVASALVMQGLMGNAQSVSSGNASPNEAIRPFHMNIPKEKLADLKRRILATEWPERETVNDQTQGVQLATMKALAQYWATAYDWRFYFFNSIGDASREAVGSLFDQACCAIK